MENILKIKNQVLFDNQQEDLSTAEKKLIQENKELFQLQFETHKNTIVRNLDKANKKLIKNMYHNDTEVKSQIDRLESDVQQDTNINKYYKIFIKKINRIKNVQKREERKLIGLMQLASMKCISVMNAEVHTKRKKGDTIEKVLSNSFYKVRNGGVDGFMGPNTASVFIDVLGRDQKLPQFDGTISKALIKKIYNECHPEVILEKMKQKMPIITPREITIQPRTGALDRMEIVVNKVNDTHATGDLGLVTTINQNKKPREYTKSEAGDKEHATGDLGLVTTINQNKKPREYTKSETGNTSTENLVVQPETITNKDKKPREYDKSKPTTNENQQTIQNQNPIQENTKPRENKKDETIINNTPITTLETIEQKEAKLEETIKSIKGALNTASKIQKNYEMADLSFVQTQEGKKTMTTISYRNESIVILGLDKETGEYFATEYSSKDHSAQTETLDIPNNQAEILTLIHDRITKLQNIVQKIIDRENGIINVGKTTQTEEKKEVMNVEKKEKLKIIDYFDPSTDRTNLVLPRLISEKNVSGTQWMNNVNSRNRTDEGRNKDSEKFMESRIKKGSIVIDIGSALGNQDPKYAGICVQELYENETIMKNTDNNIIATDIDGRGNKQAWEKNVAAKKTYDIKTEWVSTTEGFQTPVKSIVEKYGTETSPIVIRTANSIDILMSEAEAIKHFEHIAETLKNHEVTYMFNKYILHKPTDSIKFSVIGTLNEAAFDHQGVKRKTNLNRTPYILNEKGKKIIQPITAYQK